MKRFAISAALLSCAFAAQPAAMAAPVDPMVILEEFSAVALNDFNASTETEGMVYVGGNFTATNAYNVNVNATIENSSVFGASFVVAGDATINQKDGVKVAHGNAIIAGTQSRPDGVQLQGAGASLASSFGFDFSPAQLAQDFQDLSSSLRQSSATGSLDVSDMNKPTFNGSANADGVTVINLTEAEFEALKSKPEFNTAGTVVVNVAGTDVQAGNSFNFNDAAPLVIFNFYEAVELGIANGFGAAILAPFATLEAGSGGRFENVVVANNIFQGSEFDGRFEGDFGGMDDFGEVPVPGAAILMASALFGWRRFVGKKATA